jgi:hypothetical protein
MKLETKTLNLTHIALLVTIFIPRDHFHDQLVAGGRDKTLVRNTAICEVAAVVYKVALAYSNQEPKYRNLQLL